MINKSLSRVLILILFLKIHCRDTKPMLIAGCGTEVIFYDLCVGIFIFMFSVSKLSVFGFLP